MPPHRKAPTHDKRVQRTRAAVLGAFASLVTKRPYDAVRMDDIVKRSGVGRSTLYEHFSSKDAILEVSLRGPFAILADAILPADNTSRLTGLLEHFWFNRRLGLILFAGTPRRKCTAVLVEHIEHRLAPKRAGGRGCLIIPTRLAATQLAEALLTPVVAWLSEESRCPAHTLARALRTTGMALAEALRPR